jgi:hypothetical protein
MLEHPSIWQYSLALHRVTTVRHVRSENLTSADNQQVGRLKAAYPNDHNEGPVGNQRVMEWSELHGDMQTEAEMTSGR